MFAERFSFLSVIHKKIQIHKSLNNRINFQEIGLKKMKNSVL